MLSKLGSTGNCCNQSIGTILLTYTVYTLVQSPPNMVFGFFKEHYYCRDTKLFLICANKRNDDFQKHRIATVGAIDMNIFQKSGNKLESIKSYGKFKNLSLRICSLLRI